MTSDDACEKCGGRVGHHEECPRVRRPRTDELRALAIHLRDRHAAPSLHGYDLVDGLLAAAELLDGNEGPTVHDDITNPKSDAWPARVPLRALL